MPKQTFFNLPPEKREHFVAIAIDEFAENDFQNASISRIVARAGIAKGSFYQYFEDKEALYRYLLLLAVQAKAALFNTAPPDPQMDIFAYLRWLAQMGVHFELAHPKLSQIGYRAVKNGRLPPEFMAQAQSGARAFFERLVAQGKRQGDIAADIDEDLAAFIFNIIFTELGSYMMQRLAEEEGAATDSQAPFHSPAADVIFDQTLHILQWGMGRQ